MLVLTVFLGLEKKITIEFRTQKVREFLKLVISSYNTCGFMLQVNGKTSSY
jgi:hypothetical protein